MSKANRNIQTAYEAAQAQAAGLLQQASDHLADAIDASERDRLERGARVLHELVDGARSCLQSPLTSDSYGEALESLFNIEAMTDAVACAWPKSATGRAASTVAQLVHDARVHLDRTDWPAQKGDASAKARDAVHTSDGRGKPIGVDPVAASKGPPDVSGFLAQDWAAACGYTPAIVVNPEARPEDLLAWCCAEVGTIRLLADGAALSNGKIDHEPFVMEVLSRIEPAHELMRHALEKLVSREPQSGSSLRQRA